jgi:hypothetical protein
MRFLGETDSFSVWRTTSCDSPLSSMLRTCNTRAVVLDHTPLRSVWMQTNTLYSENLGPFCGRSRIHRSVGQGRTCTAPDFCI